MPQVRLTVELVVEVADGEALARAALDRVEGDSLMPDEEREQARRMVAADAGEAIAYLVDPFRLVSGLPGVELTHASWGSGAADDGEFLDEDEWGDEDEGEYAEEGGEADRGQEWDDEELPDDDGPLAGGSAGRRGSPGRGGAPE